MTAPTAPVPGTPILRGVVGSTAYNLAGPGSDVDTIGVHVADPRDVLTWGLSRGQETTVTTDPDSTTHDVGKWLRLALGGNPTVLEAAWLPAYELLTDEGRELLAIRGSLLGARALHASYGGYAAQQFGRHRDDGGLGDQPRRRRAKHVRHCLRLLMQGAELLATGAVRVRLTDDEREHLLWAGEQDAARVDGEYARLSTAFEAAYDGTSLPPEPDRGPATDLLATLRTRRL